MIIKNCQEPVPVGLTKVGLHSEPFKWTLGQYHVAGPLSPHLQMRKQKHKEIKQIA